MKIYIACGLTHVPRSLFDEYTAFIHLLANALHESDGDADVKYALINSDPQLGTKPAAERARLCYLWDRAMVEDADVVIAEASFPSTGLGIEMQLAEAKGIPIILCFRNFGANKASSQSYENPDHSRHELQIGEGFVTLMALGIPTIFRIIQYGGPTDGIARIIEAIDSLRKT